MLTADTKTVLNLDVDREIVCCCLHCCVCVQLFCIIIGTVENNLQSLRLVTTLLITSSATRAMAMMRMIKKKKMSSLSSSLSSSSDVILSSSTRLFVTVILLIVVTVCPGEFQSFFLSLPYNSSYLGGLLPFSFSPVSFLLNKDSAQNIFFFFSCVVVYGRNCVDLLMPH